METADDTHRIDVYNESPEWDIDEHRRWFMIPQHILSSLYVCSYVVPFDHLKAMARKVRAKHPGAVLVY